VHAHGVVQHHNAMAPWAFATKFSAVIAVEQGSEHPDERDAKGDQEPDPERAALGAANIPPGQAEEEEDYEGYSKTNDPVLNARYEQQKLKRKGDV